MNELKEEIQQGKQSFAMPEVLRHYGLGDRAKKSARSPFRDGDNPSAFGIFQKEDGSWNWKDFVTGEFGDEIDFIAKFENRSKNDAIIKFLELAGVKRNHPTKPPKTSQPAKKLRRRFEAEESQEPPTPFDWEKCVEALAPKVNEIAEWRGFSEDFVESIRANGLIGLHDGQVAFPVMDDAGTVIGCHYRIEDGTWRFEPKGTHVAPLVIGKPKEAKDIFVFESQWDAFAVADRLGWHEGRMDATFIITRGASNGGLVADLLNPDAKVTVWPQNDKPKKNGKIPAEEWFSAIVEAAGEQAIYRVETPKEQKDANDWIKSGVDDKTLWEAIADAKSSRKSKLTTRTVAEIIKMDFDDSDNYFGDRVIACGQSVTLLGPGGVGKSRLVLQLAISMIAGRKFLDFPTHAQGKKWLFLQSENSNRRLHQDLKNILIHFRPTETELRSINSNLVVHTIEKLEDSFMDLSTPEDKKQVQLLIEEHLPDFIVFDPLNTFSGEDLNSDQAMRNLVVSISKLSRHRNPECVPFVLHHSLTGKSGAAKAVGWDKSSYGRNSKTLFAWARAQINVAPRNPDNPNELVVSCGKNNNGKLFPDTGVLFDEQRGVYLVDPKFNSDDFREAVGIEKAKPQKILISATEIAALFGDSISRADLIKRIMAEFGCAKTRAYSAIDDALKKKFIIKKRGRNWDAEFTKPDPQTSFHDSQD